VAILRRDVERWGHQMSWNFFDPASKDLVLRVVREQSDAFLELASREGCWEDPTASGHWQVRDVVGHLVDTTEGYFEAFDSARSDAPAPDPLGVKGMDRHADEGALRFRGTPQAELVARLRDDRDRMLGILEGLTPAEWAGLLPPHKYMGQVPACIFAAGQLVDYAVHGWDIRQGAGMAHALDGDAADLLVPFCWIVWQSTAETAGVEPFTIGVRMTGHNGGETRVSVSPDGIALEPGSLDDLPLVLEFDPASFVLTAMGRMNAGTARGDTKLAERYGSLFFRI
jgi:uncharacterized protein (TIGR03083 family)